MSPTSNGEMLTRSTEDYLKAIYHLSTSDAGASTRAIAEALDLAPPSVSGMVKRLAEQGLIEHLPYRGAKLTAEGKLAALRILRRHRLIECYLVARLGYTWDTVHREAERLEHAVSDDLVERMAERLNYPRVDPHGDPIPDRDGTIEAVEQASLAEIEVGESVEVARVVTGDDDRLRYLATLGLVPGRRVAILARQPFMGPTTVRVEGKEQVVGHELARLVFCAKPASG